MGAEAAAAATTGVTESIRLPADLSNTVTGELTDGDVARRLAGRDVTLFGGDAARQASVRNRLGWIAAPAAMRTELERLRAFAADVRQAGFGRALVLGMGGSSLATEVFARVLPSGPGGIEVGILDSTDPDAVNAALDHDTITRGLFVVASKSGSTVEVDAFRRAAMNATDGGGGRFCAITDPGTSLEALARADGYRAVFTNPADIGGRFSAISLFGLVPVALRDGPLDALVEGAARVVDGLGRGEADSGLRLGTLLGTLARVGRNKLTLVLARRLMPLGAWIEQLVAESTGKAGCGILPVIAEAEPTDGEVTLASPAAYGSDRVFVRIAFAGDDAALTAQTRALDALAQAGHPLVEVRLAGPAALGAEMLRWEIATAVAGRLLGVNPFDEPDVADAKARTSEVLAQLAARGHMPEPAVPVLTPDDGLAVARHLALAGSGGYVALLAFVNPTATGAAALARAARIIRDHTHAATTVGFGPRFLHSTGQFHKGGPPGGVFVQLTARPAADRPVPGAAYSFGQLRDAQALGDLAALSGRGRPVVRVDLGTDADAGLDRLVATLARLGR